MNNTGLSAAATLLADHPISPYGDFYFEVVIEDQGSNQYVLMKTYVSASLTTNTVLTESSPSVSASKTFLLLSSPALRRQTGASAAMMPAASNIKLKKGWYGLTALVWDITAMTDTFMPKAKNRRLDGRSMVRGIPSAVVLLGQEGEMGRAWSSLR